MGTRITGSPVQKGNNKQTKSKKGGQGSRNRGWVEGDMTQGLEYSSNRQYNKELYRDCQGMYCLFRESGAGAEICRWWQMVLGRRMSSAETDREGTAGCGILRRRHFDMWQQREKKQTKNTTLTTAEFELKCCRFRVLVACTLTHRHTVMTHWYTWTRRERHGECYQ